MATTPIVAGVADSSAAWWFGTTWWQRFLRRTGVALMLAVAVYALLATRTDADGTKTIDLVAADAVAAGDLDLARPEADVKADIAALDPDATVTMGLPTGISGSIQITDASVVATTDLHVDIVGNAVVFGDQQATVAIEVRWSAVAVGDDPDDAPDVVVRVTLDTAGAFALADLNASWTSATGSPDFSVVGFVFDTTTPSTSLTGTVVIDSVVGSTIDTALGAADPVVSAALDDGLELFGATPSVDTALSMTGTLANGPVGIDALSWADSTGIWTIALNGPATGGSLTTTFAGTVDVSIDDTPMGFPADTVAVSGSPTLDGTDTTLVLTGAVAPAWADPFDVPIDLGATSIAFDFGTNPVGTIVTGPFQIGPTAVDTTARFEIGIDQNGDIRIDFTARVDDGLTIPFGDLVDEVLDVFPVIAPDVDDTTALTELVLPELDTLEIAGTAIRNRLRYSVNPDGTPNFSSARQVEMVGSTSYGGIAVDVVVALRKQPSAALAFDVVLQASNGTVGDLLADAPDDVANLPADRLAIVLSRSGIDVTSAIRTSNSISQSREVFDALVQAYCAGSDDPSGCADTTRVEAPAGLTVLGGVSLSGLPTDIKAALSSIYIDLDRNPNAIVRGTFPVFPSVSTQSARAFELGLQLPPMASPAAGTDCTNDPAPWLIGGGLSLRLRGAAAVKDASGTVTAPATLTLGLAGNIDVRVERGDVTSDGSTECGASTTNDNFSHLRAAVTADFAATVENFKFTLTGTLTSLDTYPFKPTSWLGIQRITLQLGVTAGRRLPAPPAEFTFGMRAKFTVGDGPFPPPTAPPCDPAFDPDCDANCSGGVTSAKSFDGSIWIGVGGLTGPTVKGVRFASCTGIEMNDVLSIANAISPNSVPNQWPSDLPNVALKDIEFSWATETNADLCLKAGLTIRADLYIDATPGYAPAALVGAGVCNLTQPPSPTTACTATDKTNGCFFGVEFILSTDPTNPGLAASMSIGAIDVGPFSLSDTSMQLRVAKLPAISYFKLSGGLTIDGVAEGNLDVSLGLTQGSFSGDVNLFDGIAAAHLEGQYTIEVGDWRDPGANLQSIQISGYLTQQFGQIVNTQLQPIFRSWGQMLAEVNETITYLNEGTIDQGLTSVVTLPVRIASVGTFGAAGNADVEWAADINAAVQTASDAIQELAGDVPVIEELVRLTLEGAEFEVFPAVETVWVPRTCLFVVQGGSCWTTPPTTVQICVIGCWNVNVPGIPGTWIEGFCFPAGTRDSSTSTTCHTDPVTVSIPGLCDISSFNQLFVNAGVTCGVDGVKALMRKAVDDLLYEITGLRIADVQDELASFTAALESGNFRMFDLPCAAFRFAAGSAVQSEFRLDFHLVLFNADYYINNLGWNFDVGDNLLENVAANATELVQDLLPLFLGGDPGNATSNCGEQAGGGGPSAGAPITGLTANATPATVSEGSAVTVSGAFTDPGWRSGDTVRVEVLWADGTTSVLAPTMSPAATGGIGSYSATHTLVEVSSASASQTARVTVENTRSLGTGSTTAAYTATNAAPVVALPTIAAIVEGSTATVSGTFTDAGVNDRHVIAITWGDGQTSRSDSATPTVTIVAGPTLGSWSYSATHRYIDDDADDRYTVGITVTDDDGGTATRSATQVVTNADPGLTVTPSATTIDEGSTVTLGLTATDVGIVDLHSVTIDWGDGTTPQTATMPTSSLTAAQLRNLTTITKTLSVPHAYRDDRPDPEADVYTATVTLTDDDGGTTTQTVDIAVNNVAPYDAQLAFGQLAVPEGDQVAVLASWVDPGSDTITVTIDWGDGSDPETQSTFNDNSAENPPYLSFTHLFVDDDPTGTPIDTYQMTVSVTDDDGGSAATVSTLVYDPATDTFVLTPSPVATIANVAPTLEIGLTGEVDENGSATLSASFTDPGAADTFTAIVEWGDGTPDTMVSFAATDAREFSADHQYRDDGIYTVTVTVTDDDTGSATSSLPFTVLNVPPAIDAAPDDQTPQYSDPVDTITLVATDVTGYVDADLATPVGLPPGGFETRTEVLTASTRWMYQAPADVIDPVGNLFADVPWTAGLPPATTLSIADCASDDADPLTDADGDGNADGDDIAPRQLCTWTVTGLLDAAPGAYTIEFTVADDEGGPTGTSTTLVALTVQPEDAATAYTGPTYAATTSAKSGSTTVELRTTVTDASFDPASGEHDADPGDVTKAAVEFWGRILDGDSESMTLLCTAPVVPVIAGDVSVGSAFCDWTVDIGSDDAQTWEIATVVGGWYTDNADRDDVDLVTVAKPLDNFMSGGGFLTFGTGDDNRSAGTMAADDGSRAKLSFNVKFNKKGTNLQGKAALRFVRDGQLFELRTNRLDSLGVSEDAEGRPTAQFEAKAGISLVLDDGTKVPIAGGPWVFQMDMVDDDDGEDTIGFTVWDRAGILVFSSNWSGTTTLQTTLQGSLQVHGG